MKQSEKKLTEILHEHLLKSLSPDQLRPSKLRSENEGGQNLKQNLKDWARLFRLQTLGATAMAPVLGAALAIGIDIRLAYVFIFGILVHVVGFAHNNFCDRNIDLRIIHSNPIARKEISASTAAYVIAILWMAMYLMPLFLIETDGAIVYLIVLSMSVVGTLYNMLSKKFVPSGVFLALWISTLTLSGYAFFSLDWNIPIIILCLAALMQCWNQWIEGLLKDRDTDAVNLAKILKGWRWDIFFYASLIVQVIIIDWLLWELRPILIYGSAAFFFVIASVLVWALIAEEKDRSKMLKLSGLHEILVYEAVVCCISVFIADWAIVFGLVPVLIYLAFNRLLYGEMGRPQI